MQKLSFDIFCQVVDNYGDIGVCWRLANQLSHPPFNAIVRLWVDDLNSFKKIQPKVNIKKKNQFINNVEVVLWQAENNHFYNEITPHAAVIEAFACDIPKVFKDKLNTSDNVWINLEYLSAETWVKDFHLQASPQQNGMLKYFFMPGFTSDTGGLIHEHGLGKTISKQKLLNDLGLGLDLDSSAILISYFTYSNARFDMLLKAINQTNKSALILLPQGLKLHNIDPQLTQNTGLINSKNINKSIGFELNKNIEILIYPFLEQIKFDQILFNADINFVRGEDSLVRAIWAQKPFIWQPYIQEDDLHIEKLNALLELSPFNEKHKKIMLNWSNGDDDFIDGFSDLIKTNEYQKWFDISLNWSQQLAKQDDLATAIINFIKSKQAQ